MARVHHKDFYRTRHGDIRPNKMVEVRKLSDNSLVTLYTSELGSGTKDNPFRTAKDGSYEFYLEADVYYILLNEGRHQETLPLNLTNPGQILTLGQFGDLYGSPEDVKAALEAAMNSGNPVFIPPQNEPLVISGQAASDSGTSPKLFAFPGTVTFQLQDNATEDKGGLLVAAPTGDWYIRGFTFDGNRFNQGDVSYSSSVRDYGIWVNGGVPGDIEFCNIYNTTAGAIRLLNNYSEINVLEGYGAGYNVIFVGAGGGTPVSGGHAVLRNCYYDWSGSDPFVGGGIAQGGSSTTITLRAATSFDAATAVNSDQLTAVAHGFSTNDRVRYMADGGTPIGGLTDDTMYWAIRVDDDTLQFASRRDGDAISLSAGVGTQRIFENVEEDETIIVFGAGEVTFDAATAVSGETLNIVSHGFINATRVIYYPKGNTPVGGLTEYNPQYENDPGDLPVYFVEVTDDDNFRLRTEGPEGPFVSLTASTGTHALMELQDVMHRVSSFDKSTLVATMEKSWDGGQLTVGSDTRYLIREGVTDRSLIFHGRSSSDPDAKVMSHLTLHNIQTIHEKWYPSGFAAHISTKNVQYVTGSNINLQGGGNMITIAQATKKVHLTNIALETWSGIYGFELADQTDDLVVSGVIDGHWGLDTAVQLNGGSSSVSLNGVIGRRLRKSGFKTSPTARAETTVVSYNAAAREVTLVDAGEVFADYFLILRRAADSSVEFKKIIDADQDTEVVTVEDDWTGADPVNGDEAWVQPISDGLALNGCHFESLDATLDMLFSRNFSANGGKFVTYDGTATFRWTDCEYITMQGTLIKAPNASFLNRITSGDGLVAFDHVVMQGLINPELNADDRYFRLISGTMGDDVKFLGNEHPSYDWLDVANNVISGFTDVEPEGSVAAGIGSFLINRLAGEGDIFSIKEVGTDANGWKKFFLVQEEGSNANGSYIKFTNGLMYCHHTITIGAVDGATGNIFRSNPSVSWTFPETFNANPKVTGDTRSSSSWLALGSPTTTEVGFIRAYAATSQASSTTANVEAWGTWK